MICMIHVPAFWPQYALSGGVYLCSGHYPLFGDVKRTEQDSIYPLPKLFRDLNERRRSAIKKKLLILTVVLLILTPLLFLLHPNNQNIYHDILPVLRETLPNTLQKACWKFARRLQGQYPNTADTHYVEEYVRLNSEYRQAAALLQKERALGNSGATVERQLEKLGEEREAIRLYAEAVVEQQVAAVIRDEGLLVKGLTLPPPKFLFADTYYILVTSPRREIRLEYTRLLGRDLSLTDREEIERRVEGEDPGLAVLVLPVGGLAAFYPAQIYHRGNLIRLLDLSVHEWLHQYLFVASPLGRTYLQGGRMRTINETVANMLGREIGERVYLRYYGSPEEAAAMEAAYREYLQELAERPASEPPSEGEEGFVFSSYMRETYLRAASLLEQGETEAAETYMEERRRGLVQEGYNIRCLNQAYFAFYGTYADSPGAIDSIGPALARLRLEVPSPADFLGIVKGIASYEDFLTVMEEQGIPVS